MADLAALQRAFHDACTGAAPLASASALVREDGVDPARRLRVYAHAYWARIAGTLATDFPKLRALLEAEARESPEAPEAREAPEAPEACAALDALVVPYLRAYPTQHPSLREAGVHLARFLDERGQPAHADLARLERARTEVFDGPDTARGVMTREDVLALPPEELPHLALRLVPASALVELSTPADEVWDALEDGRPPPGVAAAAGPRTVLVWRREVTVIHRTLEPDEAVALRRVQRGASFAEVCEALDDETGARAAELLLRWLDAAAIER